MGDTFKVLLCARKPGHFVVNCQLLLSIVNYCKLLSTIAKKGNLVILSPYSGQFQ